MRARLAAPAVVPVVIVVGGAGLIGRSLAKAIVDAGGVAVVASRTATRRQNLSPGIDARTVDITSASALDRLISQVHRQYGRVTGVVNATLPKGRGYGRRFEDVEYDDFCRTVGMHLGGAFLVCQRAARHFMSQGSGVIVNFGSIYGFLPPRFEIYNGTSMTKEIEYVVSKAGIIQMTAYLAKYLKDTGVRVNCISPGGVRDGQDPRFLRRYKKHCAGKGMLDASDVVGTVMFLLSDAARHMTGQNIVVDDGFSL